MTTEKACGKTCPVSPLEYIVGPLFNQFCFFPVQLFALLATVNGKGTHWRLLLVCFQAEKPLSGRGRHCLAYHLGTGSRRTKVHDRKISLSVIPPVKLLLWESRGAEEKSQGIWGEEICNTEACGFLDHSNKTINLLTHRQSFNLNLTLGFSLI